MNALSAPQGGVRPAWQVQAAEARKRVSGALAGAAAFLDGTADTPATVDAAKGRV